MLKLLQFSENLYNLDLQMHNFCSNFVRKL